MMHNTLGGQVVALVTVTEDAAAPGYLGLKPKVRTVARQAGVHFRQLSSAEDDGKTDVATEVWKLTCPPTPAALAVKPDDEVLYDGTSHPENIDLGAARAETFHVHGPIAVKTDLNGDISHVTILCKRQVG